MLGQLAAAIVSFIVAVLLVQAFQVANELKLNVAKFKKECRGLPIVKNMNIFSGHLDAILHNRFWKMVDVYKKEYGETFAMFYATRPWVMTTDLNLIKTMIVENDECNRIDRLGSPVYEIESDSIIGASDGQWRKLRRAIAPAFSSARIKSPNVQAEVQQVIEEFVDSIEDKIKLAEQQEKTGSIVLDVEDHCHRFTLAQTFRSIYKQDNLVDFYAKQDYWQHMVDKGLRTFTSRPVKLTITFPIFRPLVGSLVRFHAQGKIRTELIRFIKRQTRLNLEARQQVAQRSHNNIDQDNLILRDGSKFKRNMIDYVIDQFHDGNLTEREYIHSSFFLFLAANKTTADALSKLIYLLAIHPEVQSKLRQSIEVDGVNSEYLMWCINESIRLFPPVLAGCTRKLTKPIETKEGYLLPKGTAVITPAYSIHRLPEYWGHDAEEFKPERWANAAHFHPMQFIPFGAGKRACPGREIALHSIKHLMTVLMRRYKFEYISGTNDEMLFEAPFLIFMAFDGPTNIKISRL